MSFQFHLSFILIPLSLLILQGCESMPFSGGIGNMFGSASEIEQITKSPEVSESDQPQQVSQQLSVFLDTARPGSIGMIDVSPWATDHEIMVKDFYYSATGKKCREIRLLHSIEGLPHEQHLCMNEANEWVPIRCISR